MAFRNIQSQVGTINITNVSGERLNVTTKKEHLLKEQLVEQKRTNKILSETFEIEVTERDATL